MSIFFTNEEETNTMKKETLVIVRSSEFQKR